MQDNEQNHTLSVLLLQEKFNEFNFIPCKMLRKYLSNENFVKIADTDRIMLIIIIWGNQSRIILFFC